MTRPALRERHRQAGARGVATLPAGSVMAHCPVMRRGAGKPHNSPSPYGRSHVVLADLRAAKLVETDLREADFTDTDLREANLRKADARSAVFHRADLRMADLRGTDLSTASLVEAR